MKMKNAGISENGERECRWAGYIALISSGIVHDVYQCSLSSIDVVEYYNVILFVPSFR